MKTEWWLEVHHTGGSLDSIGPYGFCRGLWKFIKALRALPYTRSIGFVARPNPPHWMQK